ncbi:hypothetical protein [Roseateles sp. LYH14W]|uniref:Uncharacterized protein n=1 Tax=Pelomonas parva TaxID=3299032 RepID=A0ABW7FAC8_9BURK
MHRSRYRYQFDENRSEGRLREIWTAPPLTLEEAREADAFVFLWGEYGASTYLIAAAWEIRCTQQQLDDVLAMLDKEGWCDLGNAGIRYVARLEATAGVKPHHIRVGVNEIWIAQALSHLTEPVLARLAGGTARGG